MKNLPKIALTMGDPAGIGPELAVRAATNPALRKIADITIYGCPDIIEKASAKFAKDKKIKIAGTGDMKFSKVPVGKIDSRCGIEAWNAIICATKDVLSGKMDALVTAPVNKASINKSGIPFSGHTELVAELCGTANFAMMQSAGDLRVIFATTHISLKEVHRALTGKRIMEVAGLINDAIRQEGIGKPLLACAALNPHAGEDGYMGKEEIRIIIPALSKLRKKGIRIDGPFPPDVLFIDVIRNNYDGIISIYHDQGHIPFKMLAFDKGVNSTLGLPIIRTSPDHGTAFDIAWEGIANPGSLSAAIKLAAVRAAGRMKR
ncbi:MAG TPA: 4-hydroxythreonine-4-phosphate dehydrogenase PdxA [Lentisphaeria bacterium]|nr:MAG: 4-hydroxythreonine-4-phosphate dehydrogenase PdxA [Lentisphaerae bacterium GWF2_49_21]HBC86402.1 4-hydroxythreonine-4-phosphate dehydrogenase PdxA [Lentisphaeria bacterium]